jgi:hypothetical protein
MELLIKEKPVTQDL